MASYLFRNNLSRMINAHQIMKIQLLLAFLLFSFHTVFSQTKKINGDTSWYKENKKFESAFHLKNFETSSDDFNFRFRYDGQIIEIKKDAFNFNGDITNYIYRTRNPNSDKADTFRNKIILTNEKAKSIYDIILSSGILKLPSDNEIKNWKNGFDGITYFIEYSDKNNYWLKNYWTPSNQDSIPESLLVLNFIKRISDSLNLEEMYTTLKNGLPKKGCYLTGIMKMCYISNPIEFGYSGSSKMPYGFYTSYNTTYLGKTKVNSGIALQYNYSGTKFYNLNLTISKWNLLFRKSTFSDFMIYNYQKRKLDVDNSNNVFQNHQIKYGLNLKRNFSIGTGFDYLINNYKKLGGLLYVSKFFPNPNFRTILISSVFNDRLNYKAEIIKSFNLNPHLAVHCIDFALSYEDFMHYKDVYVNLQIAF